MMTKAANIEAKESRQTLHNEAKVRGYSVPNYSFKASTAPSRLFREEKKS